MLNSDKTDEVMPAPVATVDAGTTAQQSIGQERDRTDEEVARQQQLPLNELPNHQAEVTKKSPSDSPLSLPVQNSTQTPTEPRNSSLTPPSPVNGSLEAEEEPDLEGVGEDEEEEEEPLLPDDPSANSSHRQSLTPTSSSTTPSAAITALISQIHPLKCRWTLWFLNNKKDLDWLERLKKVCTITSVEEFWALYDSIRPPSALFGCDYNLFREGIQPIWEVPENKHGGRLVIQVEKSRQHEFLDQLWLELLIALIGDQFGPDTDQICGAVCNIRQKGSKISLWTTNGLNDEANKRIGMIMKNKLTAVMGVKMLPMKISYEIHSDVQIKSSSTINARLHI